MITTTFARVLFVSAVGAATWFVQQEAFRIRLKEFKKSAKRYINTSIGYPLFKEKPILSPEIFANLFFDCLVKGNSTYPDTLFSRLRRHTGDSVGKTFAALGDFLRGEVKTSHLDCLKIESSMVVLFMARCKQHFGKKRIESPRRIIWHNMPYAGYEDFAKNLAQHLPESYGYRLLREVIDPVWTELDPKSWGWLASIPSEWELRQHVCYYKDAIRSSPIVSVTSLLDNNYRSFPRISIR